MLKNAIYHNENWMRSIVSMKRFIDDGAGMRNISNRELGLWRKFLTKELGLNIKVSDWNIAETQLDSVTF